MFSITHIQFQTGNVRVTCGQQVLKRNQIVNRTRFTQFQTYYLTYQWHLHIYFII